MLGTESPGPLKHEYDYLAAIFNAKDATTLEGARNEYVRQAPALFEARDRYIARRIDATLAPEDFSILFIGKAHQTCQHLAQDILVMTLEIPSGYSGRPAGEKSERVLALASL